MRCHLVVNYKRRLDDLFTRIQNDEFLRQPELMNHWAKYLCVLVSGFLEVALREIYCEYADRKAAPHFASFVRQRLEKIYNPDTDCILRVTRWFSADWEQQLRDRLEVEHETAVNSIMGNRHQIAHGGDRLSSVTYAQVKKWYDYVVQVVDLLEEQCGL